MKYTDYNFSQTVNRFIDKLRKHNDMIEVITQGNETIILYEDIPHESIKNYSGRCDDGYKRTPEQREKMEEVRREVIRKKKHTKEHNENISKSLKNKEFTELHKVKLQIAAKRKYNKNKDKEL
jgi:hypothetical protein